MYFNGQPSPGCLSNLRIFDVEEAGDRGAGEVDVEDSDVEAL